MARDNNGWLSKVRDAKEWLGDAYVRIGKGCLSTARDDKGCLSTVRDEEGCLSTLRDA